MYEVVINWDKPGENESPITLYKLFVRSHDLTFKELPNELCDSPLVLVITQCPISIDLLINEPYLIEEGMDVIFQIVAVNSLGESAPSLPGNGAILIVKTDPPPNFTTTVVDST